MTTCVNEHRFERALGRLIERAKAIDVYAPPSSNAPTKPEEAKHSTEHHVIDVRDEDIIKPKDGVPPIEGMDKAGAGADYEDELFAFDDDAIVVSRPMHYEMLHQQVARENKLFGGYNPIVEEEDSKNQYPRRMEHEGIYVAPKPLISSWNMERYVSRLIREDLHKKLHFDEDGTVLLESDPLNPLSVRPATRGDVYIDPESLRTKVVTPVPRSGRDDWFGFRINLNTISFTDHFLFSTEDMLASHLESMYDEYKRRQTVDLMQFYTDKITAFRREARLLRQQLRDAERDAERESHRPTRDTDYSDDEYRKKYEERGANVMAKAVAKKLMLVLEHIQEARILRDEEESELQHNFKKLYAIWTQLRDWRQQKTNWMAANGFPLENTNTRDKNKNESKEKEEVVHSDIGYVGNPIRLRVRQITTNKEKDSLKWEKNIADELEERKELHELKALYQTKVAPHLLKQVSARHLASEEVREDEDGGDDDNGDNRKSAKLEGDFFDVRSVEDAIIKRMKGTLRLPGVPQYEPILDRSGLKITTEGWCDPEERTRRQKVASFKLKLVLFVNDNEVFSTEPTALTFPSFSIRLNAQKSLRILSVPESIKCRIYACHFIGDTCIGETYLPVPEFGTVPASELQQWTGNIIDPEKADTVVKEGGRRIQGSLDVLTAWEIDETTRNRPAPSFIRDPITHGSSKDQRKLDSMRHHRMVQAQRKQKLDIDPNDPRNAALISLLERARLAEARGKTFRATDFPLDLLLVDNLFHVEAARKKVLRSRHETKLFNDQVPLVDEEIPERLYQIVEVRDEDVEMDQDYVEDPNHTRFKAQWHAKQKLNSIKREVVNVKEVVREGPLPQFTLSLKFLDKLFEQRRPLRVVREDAKPISNPRACNIVIQVLRASNLPVRREPGRTAPKLQLAPQSGNVRTFVEVEVQNKFHRTKVSRGANPMWNELLSVPFVPPGESYAPSALQQVKDVIQINLFDEYNKTFGDDYRYKNTKIQRTHRRWLGRVTLPFTTVYMNGSVEGLFKVETPLSNLGYEKPSPNEPTLLWLYATLDPVLAQPSPYAELEVWRRRSPFYEYCSNWMETLQRIPHCAKRKQVTLVGDINGEPKLVCRFIKPLAPPDGMTSQVFPRFVSMIPFIEDFQQSAGVQDVYCTSNEFLTLSAGDWEEHAILLCNYFKHMEQSTHSIGWKTYIVYGHGIPEGPTTYVLRIHTQDFINDQEIVWNPVTGERYDLRTDFEKCPLASIGCVVDEFNVWANIQEVSDPSRMHYYLDNNKHWKPLFNSHWTQEKYLLPSVQVPVAYYERIEEYYIERANRIERILERSFEKWRRLPTKWNYGVSQILRDYLRELEYVKQGRSEESSENKDMQKLRQIYSKMHGFPLNFSDAGDDDIVSNLQSNPVLKTVKNTRIHESEDPGAVFALAVTIYPYPNSIGSVWVYIAQLEESDV